MPIPTPWCCKPTPKNRNTTPPKQRSTHTQPPYPIAAKEPNDMHHKTKTAGNTTACHPTTPQSPYPEYQHKKHPYNQLQCSNQPTKAYITPDSHNTSHINAKTLPHYLIKQSP